MFTKLLWRSAGILEKKMEAAIQGLTFSIPDI